MTYDQLDTSARYRVKGWPTIAVYVSGPIETMTEVERTEPCYDCERQDDDCQTCSGTGDLWFYDVEPDTDPSMARVVMVGDDRGHVVECDDLIPVDTDDVCSCGQLGCCSPASLG